MAVLQGSGAADAQGRGGSIINMASLATIYGMPFALHYTVSKAAVVGLTRGLARELGRDNIRVNSIAPSAVLTESTREFFGEKHERARGSLLEARRSSATSPGRPSRSMAGP